MDAERVLRQAEVELEDEEVYQADVDLVPSSDESNTDGELILKHFTVLWPLMHICITPEI
jgi:hypothetical protein